MKKSMCFILLIIICFSFCACNNGNGEKENTTVKSGNNLQSQNGVTSGDKNSDKLYIKELYGFKYCFPSEVTQRGSADGSVFTCNSCSFFAYKVNDMNFNSWDSIVSDCHKSAFGAIYSAFRFYPSEQDIISSEKVINKKGEELLRVKGIFISRDGDKEFIAFYHLTDENKIKFFVGIVEDNFDAVSDIVDFVADNLEKI